MGCCCIKQQTSNDCKVSLEVMNDILECGARQQVLRPAVLHQSHKAVQACRGSNQGTGVEATGWLRRKSTHARLQAHTHAALQRHNAPSNVALSGPGSWSWGGTGRRLPFCTVLTICMEGGLG